MKIRELITKPLMQGSVDEVVSAVRSNLDALQAGKIVRGRLGLLRVHGIGAYEAEARVQRGARQIEVRTDVFNDGRLQSELSLHRLEGEHIFPDGEAIAIRPVRSTQGHTFVAFAVRSLMNLGVSFEKATFLFRPSRHITRKVSAR